MQPDLTAQRGHAFFSRELDLLIHTTLVNEERIPFTMPLREQTNINWDRFLALARFHRLTPLLKNLQNSEIDIPDEIYTNLTNRILAGKKRALAFSNETVRISKLFSLHKIEIMPLKGPVLANSLYGDPGVRQSIDIDFLVHENNVDEAHKLLTEAGYRRILPDAKTGKQAAGFYRIFKKDFSYYHPEKKIPLELHWRLTSHSRLLDDDTLLWEDHVQTIFGNTPVIVPEKERTIVYLCLHGCLHQWFRLFWLSDLAMVLQTDNIDWERVLEISKKYKLNHMVTAGFKLASIVFSVSFPEPLQIFITQPGVGRIVRKSLQAIAASEIADGRMQRLHKIVYFASFRNNLLYKLKCFTDVLGRWLIMKLIRG